MVGNGDQIGYNINTVRDDKSDERKEKTMTDRMTNEQFNKVLKMIIQIIKDSETKEEAIKKIEDILNK